jgi:hypothetical protein
MGDRDTSRCHPSRTTGHTGHVPRRHRQRRDSASGGSYIDGFNIPCAAVASF